MSRVKNIQHGFFLFQVQQIRNIPQSKSPNPKQKIHQLQPNSFQFHTSQLLLISQLKNIFCYINNQHILQQYAMTNHPTKYKSKQITILEQIVNEKKINKKIEINQITDEFNLKCSSSISNFKCRNRRSIRKKLIRFNYKVKNIRHFWSPQINYIMMECISDGYKWKSIAQMPGILEYGLSGNQIKIKFQCTMRYKFKCLYRYQYKNQPPNISDKVFKTLLQKDRIREYVDLKVLTQEQSQCLVNNMEVLKVSVEDEEVSIRGKQAKQRIINAINPGYSLDMLLKTILKLNSIVKKKNDVQINSQFKSDPLLINSQQALTDNLKTCTAELNNGQQNESIFKGDNDIDQKANKRMNEISKQQEYFEQEEDEFMVPHLL